MRLLGLIFFGMCRLAFLATIVLATKLFLAFVLQPHYSLSQTWSRGWKTIRRAIVCVVLSLVGGGALAAQSSGLMGRHSSDSDTPGPSSLCLSYRYRRSHFHPELFTKYYDRIVFLMFNNNDLKYP